MSIVEEFHPVEIARAALEIAADGGELDETWSALLLEMAHSLPRCGPCVARRGTVVRLGSGMSIHAQRATWRQLPRAGREHHILSALGEDRLTASEVGKRIELEPGYPGGFHGDEMRTLLDQMVKGGELERTQEVRPPSGLSFRWRYARRVVFTAEMEALEAMLDRPAGREAE
jgi:hypothetical protein